MVYNEKRMALFSRRQFFQVIVPGSVGGAAYARYVEPDWIEVTDQPVHLGKGRIARPVRIAHLSDLHASWEVPLERIDRAFDLAIAAKPDLICVTNQHGFDPVAYRKSLQRLPKVAPAYAVLGNHDGGYSPQTLGVFGSTKYFIDLLESAGITVIENRSELVTIHGQPLRLVGTGDYWVNNVDPERAFQGIETRQLHPTILLAHNPDTKDVVSEYPWDLMLSGHTHGGQVALPLIGPPHVPVRDTRYVAGLKPWGDRQIHVTRGVGSLHRVRFNCRPEVSILNLVS